ncbi:DNA cytosine methyltransferase [Agrobacterium cavarae]|uniref:DNA cytosine methyltransferase n=1 Tax=Agrobacterium cavarae TaxID=2528239 RepID=UPI0035E42E90
MTSYSVTRQLSRRQLKPATPALRTLSPQKCLKTSPPVGLAETSALSYLSGQSRTAFHGLTRKPLATVPPRHYRPRVIELCAGAGGLALGLERGGFEHVALIERNRNAKATLRADRPHWNVVEADVRKMDFTRYRDLGMDLLTGGLPCTPFSTVGQKKGQHDKNDLMREGVRVVREIMPKAFR